MSSHDTLLSPTNVGGLELNNRVVMAPMTRNQSPENIPTDANVNYYRKRAAGGGHAARQHDVRLPGGRR